MEVVDLVGRDSLSLKQSESYVGKGAFLFGSGAPVLALHYPVISGRTAKRDSIPFVIGAYAREGAASGHLSLEMVNVRGFQVRSRGLIVAAVLVEPRNGIRIAAAVCGAGSLVGENRHRHNEWDGCQNASLQYVPAGTDRARLVDVGHRNLLEDKLVPTR